MSVLKSSLVLSLIDNVSGRAKLVNGAINRLQASHTALLGTMGRLAAFGAGYIGFTQGMSGTAGAAIQFEEAFADVRKVLNGSDEQLENIRRSIIGMSKELPIAASGIAEIYAAAGQANIPIEELNRFAEMVAKVSTAWEVPVAETGQALAEIKNQLQLGVAEVGLFADSLNHLANNSAANAPKLLEFTKRVASQGEMFGFTAQQSIAFGGAMIAAGSDADVAATSFRNMGNALTAAGTASKEKRTAFKRLGLDATKTAKAMQKDALKTTLDVIEKIQELPEWERISVARGLFGDEARSLMPVINNSSELRRQLGLVADQANYAGSSFKEYTVRASTVANVLAILRNKFADVFRSIGDRMLPTIKDAALGIGYVLDTLGERASIFDRMSTAVQGFAQGLGMTGGIREVIEDLGDMLFGKVDGSGAADQLGRIFMKFKGWGTSIRQLRDDLAENPLIKFFADLAPYGLKLFLWSAGISALARTIFSLARAMAVLSGITTIIGALKLVGRIAALVNPASKAIPGAPKGGPSAAPPIPGGKPGTSGPWGTVPKGSPLPKGMVVTPTGPKISLPSAPPSWGNALKGTALTGLLSYLGETAIRKGFQAYYGDKYVEPPSMMQNITGIWDALSSIGSGDKGKYADEAAAARADQARMSAIGGGITVDNLRQAFAPQGVQAVTVTNPQPAPVINYSPSFVVNGAISPEELARKTNEALGGLLKNTSESSYGYGRF